MEVNAIVVRLEVGLGLGTSVSGRVVGASPNLSVFAASTRAFALLESRPLDSAGGA